MSLEREGERQVRGFAAPLRIAARSAPQLVVREPEGTGGGMTNRSRDVRAAYDSRKRCAAAGDGIRSVPARLRSPLACASGLVCGGGVGKTPVADAPAGWHGQLVVRAPQALEVT